MKVEDLGGVRLLDCAPPADQFREELLRGLSQPAKTLPCKFFYDKTGSWLFERICELDVYYLTRTEISILRAHIEEIRALLGRRCLLIELGSGNSVKTRLLLDHLPEPAAYVPVDICRRQLIQVATLLNSDYPNLAVLPVCADYTRRLVLPEPSRPAARSIIFFPGSTIGNFEPAEAGEFLRRMAQAAGPNGGLLIGIDLQKDPSALERAYNDARGITAAFNLNILERANRELDADFDLGQFQHRAIYNREHGRIEMRLVSLKQQTARIGPAAIAFDAGELITTEYSYKYRLDEFTQSAARSGFQVARVWTDPQQYFAVLFLKVAAPNDPISIGQ